MEGVSMSGSHHWDHKLTASTSGSGPSSPYSNAPSQELRQLVLDYLCHHCYISTADTLANSRSMDEELAERAKAMITGNNRVTAEGNMDTQGRDPDEMDGSMNLDRSSEADMLRSASVRSAIRESILDGNIFAARQLLNEHFPTVLGAGKHSSQAPVASSPATQDSQSATPNPNAHPTTVEEGQELAYNCSVSLDYRHLSLNLRIQEFVEGLRTVPLTRTRSAGSSGHPLMSSSTFGVNPAFYSLFKHSLSPPPPHDTLKLLSEGQELWCLMSDLPSASDKVLYMEELQNVGALIAYQVPETSPVSKYMSMQRREAVAEQINCAILHRTNQTPLPYLQRYAEQTTAVWSLLEELGEQLPPASTWPPGVTLPPRVESDLKSNVSKAYADHAETPIPPFNLATYVDPRPRV